MSQIFVCHRVNTISELKNIPKQYGVEVDLRDNNYGSIYMAHDPYKNGESFDEYLNYFSHNFIILNIKSEGIEYQVRQLLQKHNVSRYFFLDSSFPMIHKLIHMNESKIAIRMSEHESIHTVLSLKDKIEWVWLDCFTRIPINYNDYLLLKKNRIKICVVSPELQSHTDRIPEFFEYFQKNKMNIDMICTKQYNIDKWKGSVQIVIPMSGIGQRFIDAGYVDVPKPFIPVDGDPMIKHVVDLFTNESTITFICNNTHLNDNSNCVKQLLYDISPTAEIHGVANNTKGPVDAIYQAFHSINDESEVIISYCDYGTSWNYFDFIQDTRSRKCDGAIACYRGFHPHMLGKDNYAFLKETEFGSRYMSAIQEKKPFTSDRMSEYASNGTYYFKSGKLLKKYSDMLIKKGDTINGEYYVSMIYQLMVENDLRVNIFEIDNMLQWGTPSDLEHYQKWSDFFVKKINGTQAHKTDLHNVTTVIPMAGYGSRFSEKQYALPKPLLDIDGGPMILAAVNSIPASSRIIFICLEEHLDTDSYELKQYLETFTRDRESQVISISNVTEGQACTCEIGIREGNIDLNKPIQISACDNGVYYDVEKYQSLVDDPTVDVIVWTFRNEQCSKNNPHMYAWVETEDDRVLSVSCKKFTPDFHNLKHSHVVIGTMFFRKASYFMDGLMQTYRKSVRTNGEFYVDDVINQNIYAGLNVRVFEVEHYICWGTPDEYETYNYWQRFFNKCHWHPYQK